MSYLNRQNLSYPQAGTWSFRPNSTSVVPPGKFVLHGNHISCLPPPIAVTPEDYLNPL